MYAKMNELDPVGGHAPGTPPRSANETERQTERQADRHLQLTLLFRIPSLSWAPPDIVGITVDEVTLFVTKHPNSTALRIRGSVRKYVIM